ncbi:uncharacterized protein METZ01_LOCUS497370, partial [marine metagenome]
WSLRLISYFIRTDTLLFKIRIHGYDKIFSLVGDKKVKTFNIIHDILMKSKDGNRMELLEDIKLKLNIRSSNSYFKMMNWHNLKTLLKKGLDIQSHTKSHGYLPVLNDNIMEKEFIDSKKQIEKKLKTSPIAVSYPYGGYNDNVIRNANKHYKYGFNTNNELLNLTQLEDDEGGKMVLSRINVTDKSPYELYFRINGFHSKIKSLFIRKIK